MFAHKYRYLFVLILSVYTYLSTVLCDVYYYFHIQTQWYTAFFTILAVTLFIWEGNRLLEPALQKVVSNKVFRIRNQLIFFAAGCVLTTLVTVVVVFLVSRVFHHYNVQQTIIPLKLNLIYAWLANLLFHLLHTIKFYFSEYQSKWMEAEQLKQMSAQAELQLIKNQINPHFLFNNLNVLSTLILKNNNEANRFIEEFSKVYRYILTIPEKELVDLKTELNFIKPYIFLLEKRFGEGLQVTVSIPENFEKFYIIPASLQLLIENAIKHNVVSKSKPLSIGLHVNGNNTLVVENNLQLRDSVSESTKIGLENIVKRYRLFSGKQVLVEKDQHRFAVVLPLLTLN